jgi:hypothetical protein
MMASLLGECYRLLFVVALVALVIMVVASCHVVFVADVYL